MWRTFLLVVVEAASILALFFGTSAAIALGCWFIGRRLFAKLGPHRDVALLCWAVVAGLLIAPSIFTFGWYGAGLGAYFGKWAPLVTAVSIPVAIFIGASVVAWVLVVPTAYALRGVELLLRSNKCPLLRPRADV